MINQPQHYISGNILLNDGYNTDIYQTPQTQFHSRPIRSIERDELNLSTKNKKSKKKKWLKGLAIGLGGILLLVFGKKICKAKAKGNTNSSGNTPPNSNP